MSLARMIFMDWAPFSIKVMLHLARWRGLICQEWYHQDIGQAAAMHQGGRSSAQPGSLRPWRALQSPDRSAERPSTSAARSILTMRAWSGCGDI